MSNRLWKWVIVIAPIAMAIYAVSPPKEQLKGSIDLVGGTSLIYELDTKDLESSATRDLAERVMEILKKRVDPNGQLNLVWRPIGNNKLQIQMPLPPKEAKERREAKDQALDAIQAQNVRRFEVEKALGLPTGEREAALDALVRGVSKRRELLQALASAYDARRQARESDDFEAEDKAEAAYDDALQSVLDTNLNVGRVRDTLAMTDKRDEAIGALKNSFPDYAGLLDAAVAKYDGWVAQKAVLEDPSDLKRLIRGAGVLEFRILPQPDPSNPTQIAATNPGLSQPISKYVDQLKKRGPRPQTGDLYQWFEIADTRDFLNAKTDAELERAKKSNRYIIESYAGKDYVLAHADPMYQQHRYALTNDQSNPWKLTRATVGRDDKGYPAVHFTLNVRGGRMFGKLTGENINKPLCILLDNIAQSAPNINSQILQNGQIAGSYTPEEAQALARTLEAGSLPARLKDTPLSEQTYGPSLGESNRNQGLNAAIWGLVAVALFVLIYYRFAGLVADIALVTNLILVLGVMAALQATFTLPGIAGLILTVGMAVDANVLIFERIREERERGTGLRKSVRLGYERALSTIVDANLTTLITCVILGYVGSEEVKGFALTLGFGVATSMFTALFMTRLIFEELIERNIIKDLKMSRIIGVPNVDWMGMWHKSWPVSLMLVVVGGASFFALSATDKERIYDIEFLGGTSVQIELKPDSAMTDDVVREHIVADSESAASWLRTAADAIRSADVSAGAAPSEFKIVSDDLTPEQVEALIRPVAEDLIERGGVELEGQHETIVRTKPEAELTVDSFKAKLAEAGDYAENAARRLASARVQSVADVGAAEAATKHRTYEIVTIESNKQLVRSAILASLGEHLQIERPISYRLVKDTRVAPDGAWPIGEEVDGRPVRELQDVIGGTAPYNIEDYKGGLVMVFDEMTPPQTTDQIERRIREMRLQPGFEQFAWKPFEVIGLQSAGEQSGDETIYSKAALVTVDENLLYFEDPDRWHERVAEPELEAAAAALSSEKSLRKVVQFAPTIANQAQQSASVAMVLALAAIVAYVWIRFGTIQFGLAAIVALVHDVMITLGLIALSDFVFATMIGKVFLLADFKIDLAMVAAILTIVGYSLNDTIVVFDRIRENRGRMGRLNANLINGSINQTLSRTLLTSGTTLITVLFMYIMGGPGVHGFAFAMLMGIGVGTYSSVAIAAPLLYRPAVLHSIVFVIAGLGAVGLIYVIVGNATATLVVGAIAAVIVAMLIRSQLKSGRPQPQPV